MKLSFLIPSKNRLKLLKYAVETIRRQKHFDLEIIVCDNASDDNYREYFQELGDQRIRYNRSANYIPVSRNWQAALDMATGDYSLMLGDDDGLSPDFCDIISRYLANDSPDIIYLSAYHYAYPNVLGFKPEGYLASVRNSEFLKGADGPFCLRPAYVEELGLSILDFRYRLGFNAQHWLVKTSLAKSFSNIGGLYQSPYPDTFAAILLLNSAPKIVVIPKELVIIGISPQSFGAYYFANRSEEGFLFLDNEDQNSSAHNAMKQWMLPGDPNNTNWLISAEFARAKQPSLREKRVNAHRYRLLQMLVILRNRYIDKRIGEGVVAEFRSGLADSEIDVFNTFAAMLERPNNEEAGDVINVYSLMERALSQFFPADIRYLDIGPHQNLLDAYNWLNCLPLDFQAGQ